MKLIFEKSVPGRGCGLLPACDVEAVSLPAGLEREVPPALPEMSETDVSRHYTELCQHVHGVNCGFYPLGSCTMKYNPRIDEEMAALPGFTAVHPLAPADATIGCREVLDTAKRYLCEITGMDDMTFQPAAGAHGEFTGVLLIKQYHDARGDSKRRKIIVPDSAHGTNPATAAMCGYEVVNIASAPNGCVDLEALKAVLGDDTAGLMLTNPNTVGIFDDNILEITRLVHEGALYKDVPLYGCILEYDGFRVLITGDCAVADPKVADFVNGRHIHLALLNFPWVTLRKGRRFVEEVLRPDHLLVYHLPFAHDDRWGYREAAVKWAAQVTGVPDVRVLLEPFQREILE